MVALGVLVVLPMVDRIETVVSGALRLLWRTAVAVLAVLGLVYLARLGGGR